MDIDEALEWLDSHVNMETGVVNDRAGVSPTMAPSTGASHAVAARRLDPPSLERMRNLLRYLGDPQLDVPFIHVTGTNGKGSTARIAASLLAADGRSVGLYTSPHLERVHERFTANGMPITDHELAEVVTAVRMAEEASGERCSWFELTTAAMYRWFNDVAVEAAVVEVGAGGRWDATNVGYGDVGVITNIDLDHMEWFGDTKIDIAREKSGIFKPGAIALIGETDPDLIDYLERRATEAGVERTWVKGVDFACDSNRLALGGRMLTLRTPTTQARDMFLPLHGAHQGENAATALAAVEAFLDQPLTEDVIRRGLSAVVNPGRMEVMGREPLVLVDGAHNAAGALAAGATLAEAFAANPQRVVVMGLLNGRDPREMLAGLGAGVRLVVACAPPSPRAMDPSHIVDAATSLGIAAVRGRSVEHAIDTALLEAAEDDLVLVTGSLYLVGAARQVLRHR